MEIKEINKTDFGKRIRDARENKGLTQKQLADLCNVSPTTVVSYEKGQKLPNIEIAYSLAYALGISIDGLCGRSPETIENFGTVIEMISALLNSEALTIKTYRADYESEFNYFALVEPFDSFIDSLNKIYELYKNGTIEKKLFDLWVKDEVDKNKTKNIKKAIEDSKPNFSAGNMDDYEDLDTDDDDLPF
ncbi:helix-turn-helix domain-containing protein [Massiliimalia timonensis]|uniref:helix-turn-helix domain-containing protein n=1 Tax=Massiliimalia timonensis TaxID=1987501 RepID=UPI0018A1097F|nr:helix-turn-helix transcriptional regulator [Massiliimalia timonensis]